jgi:inorganic pyrophosphatase
MLTCVSLRPVIGVSVRSTRGKASAVGVRTEEIGRLGTTEYKMLFRRSTDGRLVSPWHTIRMAGEEKDDGYTVRMVVEMPRGTTHKMEISKTAHGNPIMQDVIRASGAPRYIRHGPVLHHYGSVPQTWEDPRQKVGAGDDDPVDVLDVSGGVAARRGEVRSVRVLGALALIDGGETDWKVLAVDAATQDPRWKTIRDVSQVETEMPGFVDAIRHWYRVYKLAEGKPENRFRYGGRAVGRDKAMDVLAESHRHWKTLITTDDDAQQKRKVPLSLDLFEPFI